MIETHPFGLFVPASAKYLLLGSFPGRQSTQIMNTENSSWAWFYGNPKNNFWKILEKVYNRPLKTLAAKKELLSYLRIAIGDIILQCERSENGNLDKNLTNIVYNIDLISKTIAENKIEKIYFSSRFVEKKFKSNFKKIIKDHPTIILMTLPSPSPRYAAMTLQEKTNKYRKLLPRLD